LYDLVIMEKTVVRLSEVRNKGAWNFSLFSAENRKAEAALKQSPYPVVPLKEIVKKAERGFSIRPESSSEGIPLLSVQCITPKGVVIDNANRFISQEEHQKLYRSAVKRNDVLVSLLRHPNVNISAVYESDEPANLTSALVRLQLEKEKIDPRYLSTFLNSSVGQSLIQQRTIGSIQQSMTISRLLDLPIPLPPLEEQEHLLRAIQDKHSEAIKYEQEAIKLREEANELIGNLFKNE